MNNPLESYLVKLGFAVDLPSFRNFEHALSKSQGLIGAATNNIAFDLLKWQTAVFGAFTGVAGGFALMANRVANADQDYRLFGLRMMMTKDSAKSLKIALDALGEPIEAIAWDPELNQRFRQLQQDQRGMQAGLGGGFDKTMEKVRDLNFEVTRFKVELEYLGDQLVVAVFGKMGYSVDDVLAKMREWNKYIQEHMPEIADKFANVIVPALKDTWKMAQEVGTALKTAGEGVIHLIGSFSGDKSLESGQLTFENIGKAINHVTDFMKESFIEITRLEGAFAHLFGAVVFANDGEWKKAFEELKEFKNGLKSVEEASGGKDQPFKDAWLGQAWTWGKGKLGISIDPAAGVVTKGLIQSWIADAARARSINPYLALSVGAQESSFRQFDSDGNVLLGDVIPGRADRAHGVMQLMGDTAAELGVNRDDTQQNISGGVRKLAELLERYRGNTDNALAAYYMGSGNVDKYLKNGLQFPEKVQQYVQDVEGRAIKMGDTHITVTVHGQGDPNAIARAVADAQRQQQSRLAAQLAPSH